MKKLILKASVAGSAFMPFLAFAKGTDVFGLIGIFDAVVKTLLPVIVGLAVLVILWGIFNYIAGAGDEEKRAQAKQYIIWGIIGLFVMVSVWGLVNVLDKTLNLDNKAPTFDLGTFAATCDGDRTWNATKGECE